MLRKIRPLFLICLLLIPLQLKAMDVPFPLIRSMAHFPFLEHGIQPAGTYSLAMQNSYTNIYVFDYDFNFVNDMESWDLGLVLRWGLKPLTLELHLNFITIQGGIFDAFIENFHESFGYPVAGRDVFPRNQVNFRYRDHFFHHNPRAAFLPLVVSAQRKLFSNENVFITGRAFLGLPLVRQPGLSTDRNFAGIGLTAGWHSGRWSLSGGHYLAWIKAPSWLGEEGIKTQVFLLDWRISYGRFNCGLILKTSPLRHFEMANLATMVTISWRIGRNIEIGIIEDLPPYDTTPDMGFFLRITF